jgi:hypothetical protein
MLGASHASVNVLWHANGPCVDVHSVSAPPGAATGAATLAFSMANALDQQSWATSSRAIATRKTESDTPETAVLVSAVHHDVLREIEEAVEESGCTLRAVVPAPSIALLLGSQGAMERSRQCEEPIVCLHVDEEATGIAIACGGGLLLARTIEMGYATLRHAYIRSTRADHASHAEAFLAAHKRLLEAEGIPSPKSDETIAIFQDVRPFLQRLFIEVKQTVRFTLDDDKLQAARVILAGPGATIPRLGTMLAQEVGLESVETPPARQAASDPGFGIAEAARVNGAAFGIQPPGRVERRERSSQRAALLYGAVVGALILAGAAYSSLSRAVAFEGQARSLDRELAEWRNRAEAGSGVNPKTLADSLETLIESDSALRADWGATLAEIVVSCPEGVRLRGVTGSRDRDGSHLQLEALASADDADVDPHERISGFVGALQESDLVKDTHLGASEQLDMGVAGRFLRFSLTVDLVETRAPWLSAEASQ